MQHQVLAEQVTAVICSHMHNGRFAQETFSHIVAGANILSDVICICSQHYNRLLQKWSGCTPTFQLLLLTVEDSRPQICNQPAGI